MASILSHLTRKDVILDPFPHVLVENILDSNLYEDLASQFPSTTHFERGNKNKTLSNSRVDMDFKQAENNPEVSLQWKTFVRDQLNQEFLNDFTRLFKQDIEQIFPDFEQRYVRPEGLKAVNTTPSSKEEVSLQAFFCTNTPVFGTPTQVRAAHVDNPIKLFSGLFYMRDDNDDSQGGDLEIYKYKKNPKLLGRSALPYYIEKANTVRYKKNTFILFLNSVYGLHGVSVRQKTPHTRKFIYFSGKLSSLLYDLKQYQESRLERKIRQLQTLFEPSVELEPAEA